MSKRRVKVVGPAPFTVFLGIIAVLITALFLSGFPDPVSLGLAVVPALIAWRVFQLAILIEDDELVMRNLFHTIRIPIDRTVVSWSTRDIRTNLISGVQAARPDIIPTLDDDGTPTKMNVIQIIDSAEPETKGFSQCFIGVVPMKQEALYNKINNVVEAHRGSGDPFAR